MSIALTLWLFTALSLYSQLKVKPDGYVGIGTNNPVSRLHVYGEGLFDSYIGPWGRALWTRIHYRQASAYHLWNEYYYRDVFFVNGEGWLWSARGQFVDTDTSRLINPGPIEGSLEKVMQLDGVRFGYRDDRNSSLTRGPGNMRLGLVAQQVERVVPEATQVLPDSSLAVSYNDVVTLLVEAMKEQQQQMEQLKSVLAEQEEEIRELKRRRIFRKSQQSP